MQTTQMNIHRCRFVDYTPHTITTVAFSHPSAPYSVAVGDLRLAVGRSNGDIEIWNPKFNWTHEITLYGSRGRSIEGLCWAVNEEDGYTSPRLFSIGGSTYVTEWDLQTGLPKINYDCNVGVLWSMAVNKAGNRLAVGSDDGSVCIVDISGGPGSLEHEMICQRQDSRVLSIKWFDNELIVGGCADARIRCWSAVKETKGRLIGTMRVDKSKTESTLVWSVNVLSKRKQIVSGDSTGSVKVWDLNTFTLLQSFNNHDADVLCIANDFNEEKIFTAGVDRKIHQFNLINPNASNKSKNFKWVHSYNRLLHSNDVRSVAVFESKGYNFLVSGGVEKSIVIQSINQFHDGKYRKLALTQQHKNTLFNQQEKLVVMWQDQTVKIWRVVGTEDASDDEVQYKLVSKLSLADDANITSVSLNSDGNVLVVGTMESVKVFELAPNSDGKRLKVIKFRDETFDSVVRNNLLILTSNEELYKFDINVDEKKITLENEIEFTDSYDVKSDITYVSNIKNLVINKAEDTLAISRFSGVIEVVSLETFNLHKLVTLSTLPHLIEFSEQNTLVVLTEENKILEFYVKQNAKMDSLLTPWSKRNSEFLPRKFLTLEEKPERLFFDKTGKLWIYGKNWLCYFNLSINIPINKTYKNTVASKKRTRDGLTIDEDQEDEGDDEESSISIMELSLRQAQINKFREQDKDADDNDNDTENEKPFWISFKYRPILLVDSFNGENFIMVERNPHLTGSSPAFNLPKIKV
ncbi:WD40 repeat-like protein [Yamadazyma tenuis ATCC 10573]|uniref:WD40 repeat-like protein n=1 Tax=Candida tenuis (strain ATCC 10573 / BCRC 21748 / CBS 615 / JCM 9827 / NBRC 10315 / NRRL Y-1498 / VKM Y-70) TaxID=590646 RepID=G3B513_CANTC|nr:WD40 repeat-like protein [Yamadazyma tenuis ATCC 10573]EGV64032.1 WD40 repeat-like protein [Yamadazyma tenuis ATCC 10573]